MKFSCSTILLLVVLLLTSACTFAENEPSVTHSELADQAETVWPAALLPEDFPVAEYEEIYSVEQTDSAVKIILFADKGPIFTFPTVALFEEALREQGYLYCNTYTDGAYFINRDGYKVRVETSSYLESELAIINKLSPTGFTYSVTVEQTNENMDFLFLDYPAADTDLGLTECAFDTWPVEYLPDDIPAPDAGVTVERMERRKNGVFITVRGSVEDTGHYLLSVCQNGYFEINNVSVNQNGDYFFVQDLVYPTSPDGDRVMRFQFCKYTQTS